VLDRVQVSVQEWNTPQGRHLQLQDAISGGEHVLRLCGELDIASASELEAAVVRACASSAHAITLDLRGLSFIDSSGLAAIMSAGERCKGLALEFRLIPGPAEIQRVFALVGLVDRLPFQSPAV
jgi:anti-sigma B factor antagonist